MGTIAGFVPRNRFQAGASASIAATAQH